MAGAGGGLLVSRLCTRLCRGVTSIGSAYPGWLHQPQLVEPPDADPHVRWCGRGMVRITHHPLSRCVPSMNIDLEV